MVKILNKCINCGMCFNSCPLNAIEECGATWLDENDEEREPLSEEHYFINPAKCNGCLKCVESCPINNIAENDDVEEDDDEDEEEE